MCFGKVGKKMESPRQILQYKTKKCSYYCISPLWGKWLLNCINLVFLVLLYSLILSGDIDSNLDLSYAIGKAVVGSFHKRNQIFGTTAGMQCAGNVLFAICWSHIPCFHTAST